MTEIVTVLATLVRGMRLIPDPARPVRIGTRLTALVGKEGLWVTPVPRQA